MQRKIRWGLLGAGNILHRWMKGVRQVEDMEIAAVSVKNKGTGAADGGNISDSGGAYL